MAQINKPNLHFNTKLYTGNGTTNHAITGVGFQPDLNWIKERSNADNHIIHQVGFNAGDYLASNNTSGYSNSGEMTKSLDSDGFTVGTRGEVNTSSSNYVSWNWKAGGTPTANSDGNVSSTVSVNTTAGFSIVQWSGTLNNKTIGHGLGAAPQMVIAVSKGGYGYNWVVWHHKLSSGYFLKLNLTDAQSNSNAYFTADPTSSILSLTGNTAMNTSGDAMIAYCFAEKKGFSKFGSYTGNGSADGTFIYTGFKPAMVICKNISSVQDWIIKDDKRDIDNPVDQVLYPNGSYAEGSGATVDFLSNGFKARTTAANTNQSGSTFIYMAFAENPLVGTNNIPATAR